MHDKSFYSVLFILRWVHSCFDIILFVDHSVEVNKSMVIYVFLKMKCGSVIRCNVIDILHWVFQAFLGRRRSTGYS